MGIDMVRAILEEQANQARQEDEDYEDQDDYEDEEGYEEHYFNKNMQHNYEN